MIDRARVVILAGPPCSGKSTFAALHREAGDTIVDWDVLFSEMTGLPIYVQPREHIEAVRREWHRQLVHLDRGWFIQCAPGRRARSILRRQTGGSSIILAVPKAECLARLMASDRPEPVKAEQSEAISRWWLEFEVSRSMPEAVLSSVEGVTIRHDDGGPGVLIA